MKTTSGKCFGPGPFLLIVFFWLTCFSFPAVTQDKKMPSQRFFIGVAAGYYYPQHEPFRLIYDQTIWPVELQLDWDIFRNVTVFGAARYLETSGNTVSLFPQLPAETFVLNWRMATLRVGMNYRYGRSRFTPFVGLGGSFSFYREQWRDLSLSKEDQKPGFFFQAGGRYRLHRCWQALVQIDYSQVPAGSGPRGKVNLGGVSLFLGVLAGIF